MIHLHEHYTDHHGEIQESHDRYCDVCGAQANMWADNGFDIEAYKLITSKLKVNDVCICCFEKAICALPDDCEDAVINKDIEGLKVMLMPDFPCLDDNQECKEQCSNCKYIEERLTNKQQIK